MKEYIERTKEFMQGAIDCCQPHTLTAIKVKQYLEQQPAADVVERKRGEWVTTMVERAGELVRWSHAHQDCGYLYSDLRSWGHNFCPNCGADMREVDHG